VGEIEYVAKWLRIERGILDYGSAIIDAYDSFERSATSLPEQPRIHGTEYFYRKNVLLFALMMARVYTAFYNMPKSAVKLERYIERAKKL
jgi:hypothetical protein